MEPGVAPEPKKKLILILAGFGALLILIMVVLISINSSSKAPISRVPSAKTSDKTATVNNSNNEIPPVAITPAAADSWKEYKNVTYGVNYPQDWQVEELIFTGGGKGISIKPSVNLSNSENPNLTISLNDPSVNTIRKSEQAYVNMGFKRSFVKVNSFTASKLSGSLPKKTASSSASTRYIQTGYVILDQAGSNYLFDYTYINPEVDIRLENIFLKIISSLKSTQSNAQ